MGTGLRASVMIKLPAFNKLMEGDNHEDKELLEQVTLTPNKYKYTMHTYTVKDIHIYNVQY
ncbi:hypothetical protein EON63_04450 [archaeon]|nr:MAG: hypothetical protein EON63_04450 [archaeon]